jgi:two-component system cell cycle sensor histidine kinase/response regulator CckA
LPEQGTSPQPNILRFVAKNLTEMVMVYDMARKLVFVNPAVETLTGYSVEELQEANFICWIDPDDQRRMLAFWDALFDGKAFYDEEYRLVTKDGRLKSVVSSWTPILDDSGRQVGVQGREFDVTSRKLAETALRQSEERLRVGEERYRVLFENSPFPMWEEDFSDVKRYLALLAASGVSDIPTYLANHIPAVEECVRRVRVLDVNRAARDFYGASSKEELLGGLGRIFDERAFEVFREEITSFAEDHSSFHKELAVRTLRGEQRDVDMIVSIADSARQDWSCVIVSFFDITDRKRIEEQFLQSQKMESLGRLAGGIAHDFNNLLTVINGYTDWILREMPAESVFADRLREVRGAGERCAELTQQLLAFSRKQVTRPSALDLNSVVSESVAVMDRVMGDDIQISTRLAPDLGIVEADRGQMHQVLINLAVNAREAMPKGGTLTIETRNVVESAEVMLEVQDTGHGMDEVTRRRIFEPFFSTKKDSKNTGLGLAIVFGLVSGCGGRIEVHSRPGEGASFRIYLPRIKAQAAIERPTVPDEATHRGSGVVLVVEDREDVRRLTCRMLIELGYEPVDAGSGAEAIAIAERREGRIAVLLTDVIMPGMNGVELDSQVRQQFPHIRTIFMSGYSDDALTETGTLDRRILYLQKPFTLGRLAAMLRAAADGQGDVKT